MIGQYDWALHQGRYQTLYQTGATVVMTYM